MISMYLFQNGAVSVLSLLKKNTCTPRIVINSLHAATSHLNMSTNNTRTLTRNISHQELLAPGTSRTRNFSHQEHLAPRTSRTRNISHQELLAPRTSRTRNISHQEHSNSAMSNRVHLPAQGSVVQVMTPAIHSHSLQPSAATNSSPAV